MVENLIKGAQNWGKTRLISIESQPKKIFVVVVVVFLVFIIISHKNLTKIGSIRSDIL